jgi:mannose-6-phosphate isomerase-like protein (cupin superfamily)
VLAVEGGWVHTRLEIAPHAPGPPEHLHEDFEEKFTVREGTVSLLVNGEKRTLQAGDSFTVGRMTP